jgi:hypothetical protein
MLQLMPVHSADRQFSFADPDQLVAIRFNLLQRHYKRPVDPDELFFWQRFLHGSNGLFGYNGLAYGHYFNIVFNTFYI